MKLIALSFSALALAALALAATPPPMGYVGVYEAAVGNWLGGESAVPACSRSFEIGANATPVNVSVAASVVTVESISISTIQRQVQSGDTYVVSPNDWKEDGQACRSDGYLAVTGATTEQIYNLLRVYLTTAELEGITKVVGVIFSSPTDVQYECGGQAYSINFALIVQAQGNSSSVPINYNPNVVYLGQENTSGGQCLYIG